jgi:hypothetical protein
MTAVVISLAEYRASRALPRQAVAPVPAPARVTSELPSTPREFLVAVLTARTYPNFSSRANF